MRIPKQSLQYRSPLLSLFRLGMGLMALSLGVSCSSEEPVYQKRKEFGASGWRYPDSVTFEMPARDTSNYYRLVFGMRFGEQYPYRNLYVQFRSQMPSGTTRTSKPQFVLASPEGKWYVEETWGGEYRFQQVVINNLQFEETGTYKLSAKQFMRQDTLPGVRSISMKLLAMSQEEVETVRAARDSIRKARKEKDSTQKPPIDLPNLPPPRSENPSSK